MENTTLAALVCTRFIIVCRSVKYHTQNNFNSFFVYFQFWKALFWKCKQQRVCNWFGVFGLLLSTLKKAVALLIKLCNYFLYRVSHNRKRWYTTLNIIKVGKYMLDTCALSFQIVNVSNWSFLDSSNTLKWVTLYIIAY